MLSAPSPDLDPDPDVIAAPVPALDSAPASTPSPVLGLVPAPSSRCLLHAMSWRLNAASAIMSAGMLMGRDTQIAMISESDSVLLAELT
jgi:hypothetical protein